MSKIRRGHVRKEVSAISEGRRIEPAALWSQDQSARTVILQYLKRVSKDTQDTVTTLSGNGTAGVQSQYLSKGNNPKNTGDKGDGAPSEVDEYCIYLVCLACCCLSRFNPDTVVSYPQRLVTFVHPQHQASSSTIY